MGDVYYDKALMQSALQASQAKVLASLGRQDQTADGSIWKRPDYSNLPIARKIVGDRFDFSEQVGWVEDVIEFMGAPTALCLGHRYETLTHNGMKAEGSPFPGDLVWTEAEAWHRFRAEFMAYAAGAQQIAWRMRPKSEQMTDGHWVVTCRLLVWRGNA